MILALSDGFLFAGAAKEPIIMFEFGYSSVRLDGDKLTFNERLKQVWQTVPGVAQRFLLAGKIWDVTAYDLEQGKAFIKANSVSSRIRVANNNLYLDGVPIDIGPENKAVFVTEAVPWGSGVLCLGRTIPRKSIGFFRTIQGATGTSSKAREDFNGELARTLEPWCAIYINPKTHRGCDLWISGKVQQQMIALTPP